MRDNLQSYYGNRLSHALLYGGAAIAILAVLYFLIFPIKHEINKDVEGIAWKIGNSDMEKTVKVHIEGTYKQYLFHDDVFEGKINIPGASFTKDYAWEMVPVALHQGYGELTWYSDSNGLKTKHYGFIVTDVKMQHLVLGKQKGGDTFGGVGSYIITAPADNRMDAMIKTNNYFKKTMGWIQSLNIEDTL